MSRTVYFEDLHTGLRFKSEPFDMTEEGLIRFSRDNDPQFFHVDPEAAKESIFGGLIASGWQTGALTLRALLEGCGMTFAGGVVGMDAHLSWKRPVRPGDRLHIEGEITKLRASRSQPDRGFVTFKAATLNGAGEIVQTIEATMLAFRDPAREANRER
ncbi:MaoC/PaaZ C-terminal domain-containing protein [Methylocystis parvus]|uniref:Dehydratase n=1 Tax=Methylocystis parvus TaxID=134 RepID=A0A6B8MBE7_9HYPH|nr:MaoC/PaaZ C-terminal domain-containing protein [Methylocystis parvus]QGM99102.1 dehydratase [Methylocystis parvus]WBK00529.1 MaoC family dehydratase N-terminal domain-containing protein [Methylocystis parvus OBBP]